MSAEETSAIGEKVLRHDAGGPVLEHEYDGIQEYDNPLPSWWKGVFVVTIIFAIVYGFWFHGGGPGKSEHEEFERDWQQYAAWRAEAEASARIDVNEELLTTMSKDPQVIAEGRELFAANCVGCHLDDGRGQVGPNLTDEYQIHGMRRLDLFLTIRDGVPAKGMVAWGETLPIKKVATVAAFVSTLRGKNVPGKAPEGGKVGPLP